MSSGYDNPGGNKIKLHKSTTIYFCEKINKGTDLSF